MHITIQVHSNDAMHYLRVLSIKFPYVFQGTQPSREKLGSIKHYLDSLIYINSAKVFLFKKEQISRFTVLSLT